MSYGRGTGTARALRSRSLTRCIRARFTPMSPSPTRDADRKRNRLAVASTTISTSSTKRKIRLVASARRYPGRSSVMRVRGSDSSAARAMACALSGVPEKETAGIACSVSSASVETQLGDEGHGWSGLPGSASFRGVPWHAAKSARGTMAAPSGWRDKWISGEARRWACFRMNLTRNRAERMVSRLAATYRRVRVAAPPDDAAAASPSSGYAASGYAASACVTRFRPSCLDR